MTAENSRLRSMPVPASMLNELFCNKLDVDPDYATQIALVFVRDRLKALDPNITDVSVSFKQEANIVSVEISGMLNGKERRGKCEWTKHTLLTIDKPITTLIEGVANEIFAIPSVFEVPSEGTSVS